jgi:hypothetical protein
MTAIRRALGARPQRRLLAVATATMTAFVVTASAVHRAAGAPTPPPAPPYSASVPCRQDTFAHVHHPGRFTLVSPCATVTGTVAAVRWQPTDGDWQVELTLDPQYSRYVPDPRKPLDVRVIPTDVAAVVLPERGGRIAASGAWVRNRNRSGQPQLHSTWSIVPLAGPGGAGSEPSSSRPGEPSLDVRVDVPTRVWVGQQFTLSAVVTRQASSRRVPVPAAHLWLEVLPERGPAVQWQAAATNSLGVGALQIVALYRPGRYHLYLYAERGGRVTSKAEWLEVVG